MKTKIGFRCLAALLLSGTMPTAMEAGPLTFADAWQKLQQANPALQAARTEVERRTAERVATRGLQQPQIDITARQTWIDRPIAINLDPIRQAMLNLHPGVSAATLPPFITTVQGESFLKGQLSTVWPIYTGGRIRAAQRAGAAGEAESQAALRQTENTLFTELVRRYYGLQLARAAQVTRTAVLTGVEEHLRQALRLEEEGFITRADRLHADVARAEARREKQKSDRMVEIAGIALAGLLAADAAPAPGSPLFVVTSPLESVDRFVVNSTAHQPILQTLAARRAQAAEGVNAERGRLRPEVYLFGVKELNRADLTLLEPDWAAGVGVRFSLWDRTDRASRLRAARALDRRVGFLETDARHGLRTLVEKTHREVVTAQEQFVALNETLVFARENFRVRQLAFREGQATSLEVVDAQLALARVETERAASANDFIVALATLLEACGEPARFAAYEARAEEKISP